MGSLFYFIYLLSARPVSSFSVRFSSDTSGRIYLNFDAFRGSVQSTNRQTTILLFFQFSMRL